MEMVFELFYSNYKGHGGPGKQQDLGEDIQGLVPGFPRNFPCSFSPPCFICVLNRWLSWLGSLKIILVIRVGTTDTDGGDVPFALGQQLEPRKSITNSY